MGCAAGSTGDAAAYPDRPVRLIVPTPPGGAADTAARIIAPKLSEILGQPLVVDNRGGASGRIGGTMAARAAPDGYTLLALIATQITDAAVTKNTPYDLERDFAPVSRTVTVPSVLIANPALPVKSTQELIALAKTRPGQLQFASGSAGGTSDLAMRLLESTAGIRMISVPYKGVGPALVDVLAGHVPLMFGSLISALPHIKSGRVRPLGVTSPRRSGAAPDIPTIAEAGLPGYAADTWSGLVAPAGTPREIIVKLHAGVVQALQEPAIRKRFIDDGAEATPNNSPEEFAAFVRSELAKWSKVVKDAGIGAQ